MIASHGTSKPHRPRNRCVIAALVGAPATADCQRPAAHLLPTATSPPQPSLPKPFIPEPSLPKPSRGVSTSMGPNHSLPLFLPTARAISQLDDPAFLAVLLRSLAWSVACFIALHVGTDLDLHHLLALHGWLAWVADIFGSAGCIAARLLAVPAGRRRNWHAVLRPDRRSGRISILPLAAATRERIAAGPEPGTASWWL